MRYACKIYVLTCYPYLQSTHPYRDHLQACTGCTCDVAHPLDHCVQLCLSLHALAPPDQD